MRELGYKYATSHTESVNSFSIIYSHVTSSVKSVGQLHDKGILFQGDIRVNFSRPVPINTSINDVKW